METDKHEYTNKLKTERHELGGVLGCYGMNLAFVRFFLYFYFHYRKTEIKPFELGFNLS